MAQEKRQTKMGNEKSSAKLIGGASAGPAKSAPPTPPPAAPLPAVEGSINKPKAPARKIIQNETSNLGPGRRRAAPARKRIAANDDAPSIGGLIFSLQQRPSRRPFLYAGTASLVWFVLSSLMVWGIISNALSSEAGLFASLFSPSGLGALATILLPMALFWFLAMLVWRAQELKMMSSTMTEVAVRLAEPDRAAEQSIASLGQSVRRQVTAMNDAISRAIGRASELEAMVHNEVAALERSYSENEHRIRRLIDELASERTALANNSERVASALQGIGGQITRDISSVGAQVTERISSQSEAAKSDMERAGKNLTNRLMESSQVAMKAMSDKSNAVVSTMTSMNERIAQDMPQVLERLGAEQLKLDKIIEGASHTLSVMDQALGQHTNNLDQTINQKYQIVAQMFQNNLAQFDQSLEQTSKGFDKAFQNKLQHFEGKLQQNMNVLDQTMQKRVQDVDKAMTDRTLMLDDAFNKRMKALDHSLNVSNKQMNEAFTHKTNELNRVMDQRAQNLAQTLGLKTKELDQTIAKGTQHLQMKTDDVTQQVVNSIQGLISQAQKLKTVSKGIQSQVGGLNKQVEDYQTNLLKNPNNPASQDQLAQRIQGQTDDLEKLMQGYSKQLDITMDHAGNQTNQLLKELVSAEVTQNTTEILGQQPPAIGNLLAPAEQAPTNMTNTNPANPGLQSGSDMEIDAITKSLQNRATSSPQARSSNPMQNWSVGDLLARASTDKNTPAKQAPAPAFDLTRLANFVNPDNALRFWTNQSQTPNAKVPLNVYIDEGQSFLKIRQLYNQDPQFKASVASFLTGFEKSLNQVAASNGSAVDVARQLQSDKGRVYLLLMHASGRLS